MEHLLVADDIHHSMLHTGTSGDGVLKRARDWVISVGGVLSFQGMTAAGAPSFRAGAHIVAEQTNSGLTAIDETNGATETGSVIAEVRRRTGLTWDQLARLFGVSRRSVHFWASGKPMNAANEERLGRLLVVVRYIDRGNARATRTAILTALPDGVIPFDLLVHGEFDEVMRRLGACPNCAMPTLAPLSASARAARKPSSPDERVGALQDTVHRELTRTRAAAATKT